MARVKLVVEGVTEEQFVKQVLAPPFGSKGIFLLPQMVHTGGGRERVFKGGVTSYARIKGDVEKLLKQEQKSEVFISTMFDLYRLPADFPGRRAAGGEMDPLKKVAALEEAFGRDIDSKRFLPYIQLHEFEALLFSDLAPLSETYPGSRPRVEALIRSVKGLPPEHIDEGEQTAPSKRIIQHIPEYAKTKAFGAISVATKIGLDTMRKACGHFDAWLSQLEGLGRV